MKWLEWLLLMVMVLASASGGFLFCWYLLADERFQEWRHWRQVAMRDRTLREIGGDDRTVVVPQDRTGAPVVRKARMRGRRMSNR